MSDSIQLIDDPAQLLSDSVFQLNMVIWSVKIYLKMVTHR